MTLNEAKTQVEILKNSDDEVVIMSIAFLEAAEDDMTDEDIIEFVTDLMNVA